MKRISRTGKLVGEIDSFWDVLSKAGLIFKLGSFDYIDNKIPSLKSRLSDMCLLEEEADGLRRDIKYNLYSRMLIPESRGDVLGLLESSDKVLDRIKKVLTSFYIERPEIPEFVKDDFKSLADVSANGVDEMVKASRSFFSDSDIIHDFINKVYFYEEEADKLEDQIVRKIFDPSFKSDLSLKMHVRYFTGKIAQVSDDAEAVCERLSIYAIKRSF